MARRIAETGPIPVSEYVRACLYDPDGGFYMRPDGGRAGGRSGHFLTAPEVGPLFGAVLARALDAWWAELGEPEPFTVIDWGAGPGTLARAVLAAEPRCMAAGALRLVLLEVSPTQRAQHPAHPLVTSAASVEDALPNGAAAGVVVANELLDNLPFDIVRRTVDGWQELLVGLDSRSSKAQVEPQGAVLGGAAPQGAVLGGAGRRAGTETKGASQRAGAVLEGTGWQGAEPNAPDPGDGFSLTARPAAGELVEGLPHVPVGVRVSVQHAARRWVAEAHGVLREGWIVAFDYGADTAELASRSAPAGDRRPAVGWLANSRSSDGVSAGRPSAAGGSIEGEPAEGLAAAGGSVDGVAAAGGSVDGVAAAGGSVDGRAADTTQLDDLASGLGWLRTHRHHDRGASWIRNPGSCDVTADVATDQVQADHRAEVCTQAEFLLAHGIDELVSEGREVWAERADVGDLKALAARSRTREAEALLDLDGMGGYKTLLWRVG